MMVATTGLHFVLFASSIPFYIVGLIENVLVIRIVHTTREMHTPTNYILANMAVSDAITIVLLPPYAFVTNQLGHVNHNFGKVTCKSFALIEICIAVSSTTLTVLAVERYHALLKPFRIELRLSNDNVKKAMAIIWILSVLLSLPAFFFYVWSGDKCIGVWSLHMNQVTKIYLMVHATIFFTQFAIMCYCYASLIKGLCFTDTVCSETEGERSSEKKKLVLTLLLATTGFFIGYAPGMLFYTVVASVDIEQKDLHLYSVLKAIFDFLFDCSLCLNPIFYAFRSAHFRQGFKRLLTCRKMTPQNEIQLST